MKNLLLLLAALCLSANTLVAQEKGAAPLTSHPSPLTSGTTRAVVIGISDYQDERIPDLRFADRDAEAFAAWLLSPAGGSVPTEQIRLLTNEQATLGKMVASFDWLIAKSKPGDQAFIYFSGHGDVEKVTKFNRGYLLAYDMPGTTYMAGGMNLRDLEDIIATLSDAGVRVILISDACRAGKLAGSENGGTQATAAALSQQFAKEIKILSCQPDEYSLEGEQWGGGRGCFSFHLTDGLTGLADQNADLTVELREISRYLQDKVSTEADPHRQMPVTVGNAFAPVAAVDQPSLADLLKRKERETPTLLSSKSKGMEDLLLASADSSVQALYEAFAAAVGRGELMESAVDGQAANDYFERLMQAPGIEDLQGMVKRDFAAALQDDAQQVVNKLLRADPQVIDDAFPGRVRYAHLPAYLSRAAEILGEGHYMYRYLKCKQYFFEAKTFSKVTYPNLPPDSLHRLTIQALDKALQYDEDAAYVQLEMGLSYYWKSAQLDAAAAHFKRAMELSPQWVLAVYYYGRVIWHQGNLPISIEHLKEALKHDSTFLPTYERLGFFDTQNASYWRNLYVQKMERLIAAQPENIPATYYRYLGLTLHALNRNEEAEKYTLTGAKMTNWEDPLYYKQLGNIYQAQGRYEEQCEMIKKYFDLRPHDPEIFNRLFDCGYVREARLYAMKFYEPDSTNIDALEKLYYVYVANHQFEECKKIGQKAVKALDPQKDNEERLVWLANNYWWNGDLGRAEYFFKKHIDEVLATGDEKMMRSLGGPYGQLGCVKVVQGDWEEAEKWWSKQDSLTVNASAYGWRAWIAFARGQMENADSLMEEHFIKNKKEINAENLIGDALFLAAIYDLFDYSIFSLEKSTKYYPTHAPFHYHLARLYLEQKNDYEKGVPLLERAVQLDSAHAYAHYHLAAAYSHLGKNKAALDYLEKALALGYEDFEQMEKDVRWEGLRGNKKYKELMGLYMPEQGKD